MLNLNISQVASAIQEVAETTILPHFRNLHVGEIRFKAEDNPVTIADLEAEFALSRRLLDLYPGSLVIGEEAYAKNPDILTYLNSDSPVWIIDPVDGTKAFISGEPTFGVIVALAQRNQTLAGWLYDPCSKEFVVAERGAGAWHNGVRLHVMPPAPLEQMKGVLNTAFAEQLQARIGEGETRPKFYHALSSCHDHARLVVQHPHFSKRAASIHFHGTFCSCTPWDIAAGALIHHEAGGYTAHWEEDGFCPNHMNRGFLSAPDRESWNVLRNWLKQHARLPAA